MTLTDSHTHLSSPEYLGQREKLINEFTAIGGKYILNVGHDMQSNFEVLEIAEQINKMNKSLIHTAVGIHPESFHYLNLIDQEIHSYKKLKTVMSKYEEVVKRNLKKLSALGETGLDYYNLLNSWDITTEDKELSMELQKSSFRKHLELASEYDLPLTIHSRDEKGSTLCVQDTLELITEMKSGSLKGSFHSYTGNIKFLEDILNLGFYIGFNAIITYKSGESVRELLKNTPLDRVLLETDGPYLPLDSVRKDKKTLLKYGKPADVLEIAEKIAEIKGITIEEVAEQTTKNFENLFLKKS